MTLVEKLKEVSCIEGKYKWKVQIYRSDTDSKANLRVRLRVVRLERVMDSIPILRRLLFIPIKTTVYKDTEAVSIDDVQSVFNDMKERGKQLAQRFNNEKQQVESINNDN